MKKFFRPIYLIPIILCGCQPKNMDRPIDPWVVRVNLDEKPNMIGVALNEELYAAYDANLPGLYKVWKGKINFTGVVYDNIHGPQPITEGESYILEDLSKNPWVIFDKSRKESLPVRYAGYKIGNNQIQIKYIAKYLEFDIEISESVDYVLDNDMPGFHREFSVKGLQADQELGLQISYDHLAADLDTNGEIRDHKFEQRSYDWGVSNKGTALLVLEKSKSTYIDYYFESKATKEVDLEPEIHNDDSQIVNNEKLENLDDSPDALAVLGKDIIGKNDCAACHKIDLKLIGPSYQMIAQKYETSKETISLLSDKIINGGAGVWGQQPMAPHPMVSKEDAEKMAAYILSVIPDDAVQIQPGVAVDFFDVGQPLSSLPEILAGQSPNVSEVYPSIDFRSGNPDLGENTDENFSGFVKDFVLEVNGYLNVSENKVYDLQFIANNGGRLTINGEVVSEGHYYEGTFVDQIQMPLKAGPNKLKINFYHHLFDKYLILMWRENDGEEYKPIPASAFTHNPFDIKPSSPGIKTLVSNKAPGFGASLESVHPAFDLEAVRPRGFEPRVGDIEFRDNGNLVLCTWDGDIYELTNPGSSNPEDISVSKIAEGLCEPLGITIVDDEIYVLQRWELTKLIDLNGDGKTDEFVNIASFGSNASFHEWSFGLIYKEGYFYCTTGIAMGYRSENMHVDRGKVLKIAMDGTYEHVAYGLKEPNGIGFGPNDEIFVADNEGEGMPVCQIYHIPEGKKPFFGNRHVEADHLPDNLSIDPPVIWLPQNEIGNSPSQPILMKHGPYEGQLIHGEITHGGIKRDFIEKIKGQFQGAVFRFAQGLEVGINRLEWGPDGALYAAGLGGAQDFGHKGHQFGLERLVFNGNIPFEMLAIRAKSNGLEIEFTKPLRIGDGIYRTDYKVQQWYYVWTDEEESQQKRELENLEIKSVTLSEDRKRAFLELDGMKEQHVLGVQLQPTFLSVENEQLWTNEGWYTLNKFPDEPGITSSPLKKSPNTLSRNEVSEGWRLLFDGSSLKNWTNSSTSWDVQEGHIISIRKDAILLTDENFENFELEFEWTLDTDSEGGLIFNVPEDGSVQSVLQNSPRMQLIDDRSDDPRNIHTHKTGANYDIQAPKFVITNAPNEYNKGRLVVKGSQVEHWVNGINVTSYELGSNSWKNGVSASIYAGQKDYGKGRSGKISFYTKKGVIKLRNVRIREL